MKNFPVKVDNKEYWISRSVAVAVSIYTFIDGKLCVLANKRGPGLPNHAGQWNVVSGYIDFDETIPEAAKREVYEETGLSIDKTKLMLMDIDDSPKRENQVILFRYIYFYYDKNKSVTITNKYCETDEVDDIKFIPIDELNNYEWTSKNHKEKIKKYGKYIIKHHAGAKSINKKILQGEGEENVKTCINFNYDIRTR